MNDLLSALIDAALIGVGLYNIFVQPHGSQEYLIGYLFVIWGSLGSRIGRAK